MEFQPTINDVRLSPAEERASQGLLYGTYSYKTGVSSGNSKQVSIVTGDYPVRLGLAITSTEEAISKVYTDNTYTVYTTNTDTKTTNKDISGSSTATYTFTGISEYPEEKIEDYPDETLKVTADNSESSTSEVTVSLNGSEVGTFTADANTTTSNTFTVSFNDGEDNEVDVESDADSTDTIVASEVEVTYPDGYESWVDNNELTIDSRNDAQSESVEELAYEEPTVDSKGDENHSGVIYIPGSNKQKPSTGFKGPELIVPKNSDILIEVTNESANSGDIFVKATYYEYR